MTKILSIAVTLCVLAAGSAHAECAYKNTVPVKAYFAAFPAWKVVAAAMKECGNFQAELDQEIRSKGALAFAARPALYHIGGVHNGTIVPLLSQNTIRPLDDLVQKYGQTLRPNQLIKIDGKTMAIALMVNMQHLVYRRDILDQLGIAVPTTYDEVLAAAQKIKQAGVVQFPLGATYKADWNIAIDFNNLFVGYGGTFVNPDNTPTVNSEAGVKALEMMKRLSQYLDPEYLAADATAVQQQFQQGKIAMSNFWASRVSALDDPKESRVVGKIATAAAPAVTKGGIPAVQFSWDGFAIARNITDAEAEAAFRVAVSGANAAMVAANNDVAVWLIDGFKPGPAAKGSIDTIKNGAPTAHSTAWRGVMDAATTKNVPDFMLGKRTAEQTLQKIAADYTISAQEVGLLKR